MKCFVYCRISRDREGAGLGVERQEADCRALAESLGWTVAHVYVDNDISASSGARRPQYEAMMAAVDSGEVGGLLAWHTDRLHRRPVELESFIDVCERRHVDVRTVRAGNVDLSTASGRMVARMLGAAARHETEHMSERQRRSKQQAAEAGRFRGGRRAYGYTADGAGLVDDEVEHLRWASEQILGGASLRSVVRGLEDRGARSARDEKPMHPRDVKRILLSPRYAGLSTYHGEIVGKAQWPAVWGEATMQAHSAILTDPTRRTSHTQERKYLLSGIAVCGRCGSVMSSRGMDKNRRRIYRCKATDHLGRVQEPLDEYVTELVLRRLRMDDFRAAPPTPAVPDHSQRRAELEKRLAELATMFAEGTITGGQLAAGSAPLRDELAQLDNEVGRARAEASAAELLADRDHVAERWEGMTIDEKARVVDLLMRVTVLPAPRGRQPGGGYFSPDSIRIEWKR